MGFKYPDGLPTMLIVLAISQGWRSIPLLSAKMDCMLVFVISLRLAFNFYNTPMSSREYIELEDIMISNIERQKCYFLLYVIHRKLMYA